MKQTHNLPETIAPGETLAGVQLCPFGEFPNGKTVQVCDEAAFNKLVESFNANGAKEVLCDFEHKSEDPSLTSDTAAATWISNLAVNKERGLVGDLKFTEEHKAVCNKVVKSAIVKYEVEPHTLVRAGSSSGNLEVDWGTVYGAENVNLEGKVLAYKSGDSVKIADASHTWTFTGNAITSASDTAMELNYMKATREDGQEAFAPEADGTLTITYKGSSIQAAYKTNRM